MKTRMQPRVPGRLSGFLLITTLLAAFSAGTAASAAETAFDEALLSIQHRWAEANYAQEGKAQKEAFASLLDDARELAERNGDRAEALVWQGIVASSYAGVKGPFGAMSLAKEARDALLAAERIDPDALDGSVYTSLGVLYSKVPGGLIGFGDRDIARDYLEKALAANPEGIDPNYFYGEFLFEEKDYAAAREALLKARQAPARSDRPLADEGRRSEISALLARVENELQHSG
jgi:tetratricopeptide (TPR) repeat protein